jgi:coproporphyrinogen III oxidase-like Fe-S oxidoreductase
LTIEPGTRFGDLAARGRLQGLPHSELAADLYEATQGICDAAGLPAYEVSNHAGGGAEGQHNLVYWRYGDYAGIGPGAHGRLTLDGERRATAAIRSPEAWIESVESGGRGVAHREVLSGSTQATEMAMMGLRLSEGIDLDRYDRLSGRPLPKAGVAELVDLGLLRLVGRRLTATAAGRPVLDALLRRLLGQRDSSWQSPSSSSSEE